jgi:hypothetical protein
MSAVAMPLPLSVTTTEDDRPERPDQEADGEDCHRAEEGRHRVTLLEELDGQDRSQAPEDIEV